MSVKSEFETKATKELRETMRIELEIAEMQQQIGAAKAGLRGEQSTTKREVRGGAVCAHYRADA